MPRRALQFDGEVWHCTHCRGWWSPGSLADPAYAALFRRGGPAGFDPETGFEAQDRPRERSDPGGPKRRALRSRRQRAR
jgi:hypothetical protein